MPSAGTPGALCPAGFAYTPLAPPPVAQRPPLALSFHAASGMYPSAEAEVEEFEPDQYWLAFEPSLNSVPPTQVSYGVEHIPLTARPPTPRLSLPPSQPAAPLSPDATRT